MQICQVEGCGGKHIAQGLCFPHYQQLRRKGCLPFCKVDGCGKIAIREGWCLAHREEYLYNKEHPAENLRSPPIVEFDGEIYHIWLYNQKREKVGECLLDPDSWEKVKNCRMHAQHRKGTKWAWQKEYVQCSQAGKYVSLSRLLMGASPEEEVDHINGNTFDNRKENLRLCTRSQNLMNRNVRGYCKNGDGWTAYLHSGKERKYYEHFKTEEEAREGRRRAEDKFFGEWKYREEPSVSPS